MDQCRGERLSVGSIYIVHRAASRWALPHISSFVYHTVDVIFSVPLLLYIAADACNKTQHEVS